MIPVWTGWFTDNPQVRKATGEYLLIAGPMFSRRIDVERGEVVHRDGFAFADLSLRELRVR